MAKALIAVVFATLLVASLAQPKFDCDGAKEISKVGGACNLLCSCAASLNKSFNNDGAKKQCNEQCESCKNAASKCKSGSDLPQECKAGANVKEVQSCINTFLKTRSGR